MAVGLGHMKFVEESGGPTTHPMMQASWAELDEVDLEAFRAVPSGARWGRGGS